MYFLTHMLSKNSLALALLLSLSTSPVFAYKFSDQLSIDAMLAGTVQCQNITDAPGFENTCETTFPFQPEINFRPGKSDQIFFKFGFAAGNGLAEKSPFNLATWAADIKDSENSINGRNNGHLLTGWYKHIFRFSNEQNLSFTIGIIDGTDFLDINAYANDEYTQFMNAALTNGPNIFIPSYEIGTTLEWINGRWSLSGVLMDIQENDAGKGYIFYGIQAGYSVDNHFGTSNYRLILTGTSSEFPDSEGIQLESRSSTLISIDQELGDVVGVWTRIGWQTNEAAINYRTIFSGGIDIKGVDWGRVHDNIGLGLAYLNGGNINIDNTQIAEAYYRWQLSDALGLTADIQYLNDEYNIGLGPKGMIYSLRAVAEF